ncbi:MAG: hypothetical protein IT368_04535 [Candidatus Hydrogenedentes bacterium]|nr:hypothetical protein [Candidatus Hydrogenedentota bacterium]
MRRTLVIVQRLALVTAAGSLAWLLFMFGHTELTPHGRVVEVAALAGGSALVGGLLHWVGLPSGRKETRGTGRRRRPTG